MPQSFDPVFGSWFTEKQIGSGTDGKVYEIKLGETVSVPRAVADIIKNSLKADMEVREKMNALSGGASELGAY